MNLNCSWNLKLCVSLKTFQIQLFIIILQCTMLLFGVLIKFYLQGCRSVEEFQCLNRIEEGTYGVVYRARDKTSDEIVALKRLKMEKEKEGFPITSLREINTLLKVGSLYHLLLVVSSLEPSCCFIAHTLKVLIVSVLFSLHVQLLGP